MTSSTRNTAARGAAFDFVTTRRDLGLSARYAEVAIYWSG